MKIALVIGGADCVTSDLINALEMFKPDSFYGVNDIGTSIERLDVWCTLHPEFMDDWEAQRKKRGFSNNYEVVAPLEKEVDNHKEKGKIDRRVSYRWPDMKSSASSGIYATKVALEDGYHVVLAGVPMDNSNHFKRQKPWNQMICFDLGFQVAIPHLIGRVKSMSGRTKEILGIPTPEWLENGHAKEF